MLRSVWRVRASTELLFRCPTTPARRHTVQEQLSRLYVVDAILRASASLRATRPSRFREPVLRASTSRRETTLRGHRSGTRISLTATVVCATFMTSQMAY